MLTEQKPPENGEIEGLVREIGLLIERAEPRRREELRQAAAALLQGEMSRIEVQNQNRARSVRRPLHPVALGILVLALGGVLSVVFPPVGLILVGAGLMGMVSGALFKLARD